MRRILLFGGALVGAALVAAGVRAQSGASPDVQVQLGDLFLADGRYVDAQDAYRRAVDAGDASISVRAGAGLVLALLRTGEFQRAYDASSRLAERHPSNSAIMAVRGDALWSIGRFEDAESSYDAALATDERQSRARHGRARSLAARNRLTEALADAEQALALNPRDAEFHHTVASIHERMRHYEEASRALASYVDLLP